MELDPVRWVDEFGDLLFHIAIRRTGNRETAEDLVQEALLAGLQSIASLENRTVRGLRAWLCRILQNKITDHYRRKAVRKEDYFAEEGEWAGHWNQSSAPGPWLDPAQILLQKELRAKMDECMGELAPTPHRALWLREISGMSASKTANILGVTEQNLYVILHRARLALRSCLESSYGIKAL
jgi:RNA polymerase sigma factor (sigma-70 family)